LLVKWRARYQVISQEEQQMHLETSDFKTAKREIKRLQRRLAEVEEKREILHLPWRAVPGKKRSIYFHGKANEIQIHSGTSVGI
jgi:hypothetical protein